MKSFIIYYVLYMTIAFIIVDYEPLREILRLDNYYTNAVTYLSYFLIESIGIPVSVDGRLLILSGAIMEVKFGCNGLEAILLYIAAVLAFPGKFKIRLIGIFVGSIALQIVNLFRITILAWVLEYKEDIFPIMHEYITQSIMIAIALVAFLVYIEFARRKSA